MDIFRLFRSRHRFDGGLRMDVRGLEMPKGKFAKASPDLRARYDRIVALAAEGVWVPAVSNGGLLQLLAEMEKRGWKIVSPALSKKRGGDSCACGEGTWGQECPQGPYCR